MSFKILLATERQLRRAAEAEVARLQVLLETATASAATKAAPPTAQNYSQAAEHVEPAEQQLEDEQIFVRQVIDSSPNLVYVEDEDGKCILANKRYAHLLSQRESAEKLPAATSLLEPEPTQAEQSLHPTTVFHEAYLLRDGQRLVYHTTKSSLLRSDGTRYLLTFSSDITDLKRAHGLAEELVQTKQLLMANMSHEIRTPLHGITGLTELLKKGALSDEQASYLEMIQYNTDNLLMVVDDILEFTKIESGQINLEHIPFDLLKAVQHAARSFAYKVAEKGLLLRIVEVGVSAPHTLLVGQVQGTKDVEAIKATTKQLHDITPATLLVNAAYGLAKALRISHAVGVSTQEQLRNGIEFYFDYDAFWTQFRGERLANHLYLLDIDAPERPIEETKAKYRLRTLRKRQYKQQVRAEIAQYFQATFLLATKQFSAACAGFLLRPELRKNGKPGVPSWAVSKRLCIRGKKKPMLSRLRG